MKPKFTVPPKEPFKNISTNILRILRTPLTTHDNTRLNENVRKLLSGYKNDLHINDISEVTKLLLVLFEKSEYSELHLNHFLDILNLCWYKFKLYQSGYIAKMIESFTNLFNALAFLLGGTQNSKITQPILLTLRKIGQITKRTTSFLYKSVSMEGLIKSELPNILTELLEISDENYYHNLLKTLESLLISDTICYGFIKLNIFDIVMNKLNVPSSLGTGRRSTYEELIHCNLPDHVHTSKNVLFGLIDAFTKSSTTFKDYIFNHCQITRVSWKCIAEIFYILVATNDQRTLRNNYFLLVRLLSNAFNVDHALSYLDGYKLIFATEIVQNSWVSQVRFQPDDLDFDFKVLSLSMLGIDCPYESTVHLLKKMKAMQGLIKIINPEENLIWNDGQRKALMIHALIAIENVVLNVLDEFVNGNGPKILVNLLRLSLDDIYPIQLAIPALKCIRKTLKGNYKIIDYEYRKENILSLLVQCLKDLINLQHFSKTNQNFLILIYCILEKLSINKEKETPDIIKRSIEIMKRYLSPSLNDFFLPPIGLIAILDFLWINVVESTESLNHFMSNEGVFVLMDVIERFPIAMKVLGLSILTDLCEIGGLSSILTWRGKTGDTVIPFLMKIYQKQCQFDNGACAIYTTRSGHTKIINNKCGHKHKTQDSCLTCLGMLGNCKPKIYAILYMINCHWQSNLVNKTYKLSEPLNYQDKVTLLLAEYYYPLKIGEVWTELNHDMEQSGIRPLLFDQELIAFNIRKYTDLSNFVRHEQNKLFLEQEVKDKQDEMRLYNYLKESTLSESLDALQQLKHHALCSEHVFRLAAASKMIAKLDDRKGRSKESFVRFHSTVPRAGVTYFGGQKADVDPKIEDIKESNKKLECFLPLIDSEQSMQGRIKNSPSNSSRNKRFLKYFNKNL